MVTFERHKKDSIFSVYSLKDYSYRYSFGKIGQGPQEFLMPIFQRPIDNKLLVYDFYSRKLSTYVLENKGIVERLDRTVPKEIGDVEKIALYGDYMIGVPMDNQGSIFLYNTDTKSMDYMPYNDYLLPTSVKNNCLSYFFDTQLIVGKAQVISPMLLFPVINLYDLNTKQTKTVSFVSDFDPVKYKPKACYDKHTYTEETTFYYLDIVQHKGYNYAVFMDNNDTYFLSLSDENTSGVELHVFNNELSHAERWKLPIYTRKIAVNKLDDSVIGIFEFNEKFGLFRVKNN